MVPITVRRGVAVSLALGMAAGLAACGSHRDPPATVVAHARARTLAAGQAQVQVATPARTLTGVLRPRAGTGTIAGRAVDAQAASGSLAELLTADPFLAIDLVEGRTRVNTYGGAEIRGTSAFAYNLDVSPARALQLAPPGRQAPIRALLAQMHRPTLFADIWVDGNGRLLRIQVPVDPNETRPGYLGGKLVAVVTVDLYGFQ